MKLGSIIVATVLAIATGANAADVAFRLETKNDSTHVLRIGESEGFPLPFPVYRFDTGDVDGNGVVDAIVGVEKSTRYDPVVRRRLFIFKNHHGHVRPLWLGSRLGQPIIDFRFVPESANIRVIETEASGLFLVAEYRWKSFGMDFVRFLRRECTENEARILLNEE